MENLWEFNIQKEIITDVKRKNKFLSKEISESIWLISKEKAVNRV